MKIGLIGCGRMGSALIGGIAKSNITPPGNIIVHDPNAESVETLVNSIAASPAENNTDLSSKSDTILLAVKPQYVTSILEEIASVITPNHLIVSIAAGVTINKMEACCPEGTRIIRAMPNTPAMIGYGATGIAAGHNATSDDLGIARKMMQSVGTVVETTEPQLDAVTGLSGSGPAYVYTMIKALANQAEEEGLESGDALQLATRTVMGAAHMLEQTAKSPQDLIDQVTSPGGTTLAGLAVLAELGFENTVAQCVHKATERSREIATES
jgi:pyrroline-5-carboxylate reductase